MRAYIYVCEYGYVCHRLGVRSDDNLGLVLIFHHIWNKAIAVWYHCIDQASSLGVSWESPVLAPHLTSAALGLELYIITQLAFRGF